MSCKENSNDVSPEETLNANVPDELPSEEISEEILALTNEFSSVVVISEKSCLNCNRKMVDVTSRLLLDYKFGVVLEATGGLFDISPLLVEEFADYVRQDFRQQLSKKYMATQSFLLTSKPENSTEFEVFEITSDNMDQFENLLLQKLSQK